MSLSSPSWFSCTQLSYSNNLWLNHWYTKIFIPDHHIFPIVLAAVSRTKDAVQEQVNPPLAILLSAKKVQFLSYWRKMSVTAVLGTLLYD